jgi:hypothetical protein
MVVYDNYHESLKLFTPTHLISDMGQTRAQNEDRKIRTSHNGMRESYQTMNKVFNNKIEEALQRLHPSDLTSQDYFAPG